MKKIFLSPMATGHLLALGATVIWSSLYIFARTLTGDFSPVELAFWRWLVAFAAFYPFVHTRVWACRAAIRRHFVFLAVVSAIGMVGFTLLIFMAGRSTSATNMSLLAATAPVFIALITRFILKEELSRQQVVGLGIAVCGVVVLVTRGDIAHLLNLNLSLGDVWMMGGALCFGVYSVLLRFRPPAIPPVAFLTVLMGLGALWTLPGVVWHWTCVKPFILPSAIQWLSLLHIGVMTSVVAFLMWNQAIAKIGAVRAGVMYYSLPFFSYLLAMLLLGEALTLPQALGGILIVGGIVFSSLEAIRRAHSAQATLANKDNQGGTQ